MLRNNIKDKHPEIKINLNNFQDHVIILLEIVR